MSKVSVGPSEVSLASWIGYFEVFLGLIFILSRTRLFYLCPFPMQGHTCKDALPVSFPVGPHLTCYISVLEYILGTVHKAKGLEFDTVHVLDDFVKVPCARHNLAQLPHFRVGKEHWVGRDTGALGMLLFYSWS